MQLQIVAGTEDYTHVALEGRLDTPGVDEVETRFTAAFKRGRHGIVDLSGVSFLASMGIRMLISAAKMVDRRGGKLVLMAPQPLVDQALVHSAVDELLPIVPDLEAARGLLDA